MSFNQIQTGFVCVQYRYTIQYSIQNIYIYTIEGSFELLFQLNLIKYTDIEKCEVILNKSFDFF